jgi:hypothetical protein
MVLEELLAMINGDIMEKKRGENEGRDRNEPISITKAKTQRYGTKYGRKRITQDDLSWLGLGSTFWTKLEIEQYTRQLNTPALAEISNQSHIAPPPHEFDHPKHPLHRRVGHGWMHWDALVRARGNDEFGQVEDLIETMGQFNVMAKRFVSADRTWERRSRMKAKKQGSRVGGIGGRQGKCLGRFSVRLDHKTT